MKISMIPSDKFNRNTQLFAQVFNLNNSSCTSMTEIHEKELLQPQTSRAVSNTSFWTPEVRWMLCARKIEIELNFSRNWKLNTFLTNKYLGVWISGSSPTNQSSAQVASSTTQITAWAANLPCPSSSSSVLKPWSPRSSPSVVSSWKPEEVSSHSCRPPLPLQGPRLVNEASLSPFS